MKKYFHGKRYIRSRYTVIIGRQNKQTRKMERWIRIINNIDWNRVFDNFINATKDLIASIERRLIKENENGS